MTKDQIEKLRPGFEAAIIERFKESGFLEVEIRVECLSRCGDSYDDSQVAIAWWSWCLSRERLVVELPQRFYMQAGDGPGVYPQAEPDGEWMEATSVADSIISAGGTVKS